ncbi:MAG: hypothetical protein L6R38_000062 [Xanthoria sp. 2 TBL-2021]|nr:MAG: hypothetical protein L6R38_000062 [Xanthoria sp. 2 TBL-2021]
MMLPVLIVVFQSLNSSAQTVTDAVPPVIHANKTAVAPTARSNALGTPATLQAHKYAAQTAGHVQEVAIAWREAAVPQVNNRADHPTATIQQRSNAARMPSADAKRISRAAGNICTITSTYSSTRLATHVVTVTKIREPAGEEEAPEFQCMPMTATNAVGDTLELGDDCGLTFEPADPAGSANPTNPANPGAPGITNATSNPTTTPTLGLKRRATQGDDTCIYTSTDIVTYTVNTITTTTITVTREEPSPAFSCLPMSVENVVGDELALDEQCKLEFTPADSPADNSAAEATGSVDSPAGASGDSIGQASHSMGFPVASGSAALLAVLVQIFLLM